MTRISRRHFVKLGGATAALAVSKVSLAAAAVASYTRDEHFILDGVPGAKGVYVMTGCQEAGITHGPPLGKMMTELVLDGHTQVDRSGVPADAFQLHRGRDALAVDEPEAPDRR
jgi:sarcosine oxidase, subunit beta